MPIPKLPGNYIPPYDEWGPPPTQGDLPDSPDIDPSMVIPAPEPGIDPNMREIDARKMPEGWEHVQRPENNVDILRPLIHNIADVQVSEAQPPADFNTLFNTPLDEDYRKNLEARDQAEGDDYLSNLVGPSAIQPQQSSWWDTAKAVGSGALAVGKDLSGAFTEAGHWAIGGPLRGAEAIIDSARDTATWMNENVGEIPFAIQLYDKDGAFKPKALFGNEAKGIKEIDINLPNPGGVRDVPETVTASILQGLTQFATGYGLAGRATGIGNSFGGALAKGFIADYASQQGNEPNFANLLQAAEQVFPGVMKPVNEYINVDALAAKPGDANAEGRLRNALVGIVPNVLIPVVVAGARRIRAARAATELADNAVTPKIGQADAIDNAVRPVPVAPAEAVIGTVDEPLIARVEQKIGPNDLGVPTHVAALGLEKNSVAGATQSVAGVDDVARAATATPEAARKMLLHRAERAGADISNNYPIFHGTLENPEPRDIKKLLDNVNRYYIPEMGGNEPALRFGFDKDGKLYVADARSLTHDDMAGGGRFSVVRKGFISKDGIIEAGDDARDPGITRQWESVAQPWIDKLESDLKGYRRPQAPPPPGGTPPAPANGPQPGPFSSEFKFNWSKIETDADMKAMAGQVMDAFAPELKARGKGVVQTWQETAAKANALSAIEMLVEEGAVKGKALDAVQLEAAGNIYVSALKDLKRVTQIATSPNAGPEDLMAWDHMLRVFRMAQNLYVPAQAEAGRALNILRKTKGESALYTQELRRMVSAMGGEDVLRAKAAAISDLLQRGADKLPPSVIQKSLTAKSLDTVIELWKAGLLTGPKTHIVNFASNAQVLGLVVGERKIAGMIGEVLDPISGVKAQEAGYLAWGMKQHLRDAFRAMAKTFKTNQQQWGGAQAELPYVQRMSSEHWGVNPESFMGKGLDMMGSVTNLPFRALGASDAFFKELHYGAELKASALRAASEEVARGKIPADQFAIRLQDLLDNPTEAIRAGARDFASVNTFTSEPGRILTAINQLRNADHAGLRFLGNFVMPFTNTPGKILNFFTDRSPIGLVSNQMRAEIAEGGAKRDIALAKMGVGTIALGVGYDLAMDGWVTGPGPAKNDNKRQAMMRGGWRPWSIKMPDGIGKDGMPTFVYVPISRFDPGAMPLLMGAALAEITRYQGGKVNREWDEIWAASTMSLADVMMQKTTMIGFANLVQAMSEPSQFADRYMKSAARSFVPAGVAWIEEIKDPVLRQTWSLWAAAKERTPYLSETLPPRLDIWGRELSAEGMLGQPWEALIPSRMSSTGKALPVDRELLRLNRALRYPSYIPIKGRNIPLDNLPEAQNRLVTLMNAKASALLSDENLNDLADNRKQHVIRALEAFEDRSLVEALSEMIKGEGPFGDKYLEADDEEKGQLISDVKSKYEQAARVQVLREFPKIREIRDNLPERSDLGIEAPF